MRRGQSGFTLIELLIVVVIIGILAAIAIPKFANTKEKAYVASMKSDLRNLVSAQESYMGDNQIYASAISALAFAQSTGVTVTIATGTASEWGATASHSGTTITCAIFYGSGATPIAPATKEGQPACQ